MRIKYLLLVGLLFLFSDCQKDDLSIQQEAIAVEPVSNLISGEEAPDVINFLDQLFNTEGLKLGEINLPFDKKLVDKKTIAKVKDPKTGYTNFSFAVKRKNKDNFLFQVIVTKYGKNDFSDPYIFQFRFDDAFRKKLNKGKADWSEYIWPIYPYSLRGAAEALEKAGPLLDCPPIEPDDSNGSGGGGVLDGPDHIITDPTYRIQLDTYVFHTPCDPGNGCPGTEMAGDAGDCPDPPGGAVGIVDPGELTLVEKSEYLQDQINVHRSGASIESLKGDPWFKSLIASLIDRPDNVPSHLWPDMAVEIYVQEYAETVAQHGLLPIPGGHHYITIGRLLGKQITQKIDSAINELNIIYDQVKDNLPQNSQEWADLGLMMAPQLGLEIAGFFNPVAGAAVALGDAWKEFDNGNAITAGVFLLSAVAEFVPWAKLVDSLADVSRIALKSFKYFRSWKILKITPEFAFHTDALKYVNKIKTRGVLQSDGVDNFVDIKKVWVEKFPETVFANGNTKVVRHHAIEQQALDLYPGIISLEEMHSISNLRGIPNELNNSMHLSNQFIHGKGIRGEWTEFYEKFEDLGRFPSKKELLDKVTDIDNKLGHLFYPPIRD